MTAGLESFFRLTKAHEGPAAAVAARAFYSYPLMDYFNPDDSAREQRLSFVFQQTVRYCLHYGEGYATSPNLEGLALWLPFHKSRRTLWRRIMSGIFSLSRGDEGVRARQKAFEAHTAAMHSRQAGKAQLYLQLLAVEPEQQGKGHGGALLRAMFAQTDRQGVNSFLETHVAGNVEIYKHLGFRLVEEERLAGTELITYAMLREAQ